MPEIQQEIPPSYPRHKPEVDIPADIDIDENNDIPINLPIPEQLPGKGNFNQIRHYM
jgi:hypothetical protein